MSDEVVAALMRKAQEVGEAVARMEGCLQRLARGQESLASGQRGLDARLGAIEHAALVDGAHRDGVADERARWLRVARLAWAAVRSRFGTWATVAAGAILYEIVTK